MCFAFQKNLTRLTKGATKQVLEFFDLYNLKRGETAIRLYISRKRATTSTRIHCTEAGDIIWEQFYPFGGMSRPAREKKYVLKPEEDKWAISIVIIKGKPNDIVGLDDAIIKSHLAEPKPNGIYLMSEKDVTRFLEAI